MGVVTTGLDILEEATRAKTELILILAEPEKEEYKKWYQRFQEEIKAAEDEGLVDVQVSESENSITTVMITITIMITIILSSTKVEYHEPHLYCHHKQSQNLQELESKNHIEGGHKSQDRINPGTGRV